MVAGVAEYVVANRHDMIYIIYIIIYTFNIDAVTCVKAAGVEGHGVTITGAVKVDTVIGVRLAVIVRDGVAIARPCRFAIQMNAVQVRVAGVTPNGIVA